MELLKLWETFRDGLWLLDTEYATPPGDPVIPVCVVGREFFSGRQIQLFFYPGQDYTNPFPVGKDALFVAYAAQAEWSCFMSLGWELPERIVDLYAEFRNEISGRVPPIGHDFDARLIGAMDYYHLDRIAAAEKKEMQDRIAKGHPFTSEEHSAILTYCESDVVCLEKLLPAMAPAIELPYAILRGRYTKAVARIERAGYPVDRDLYERVVRNLDPLKSRLIENFEAEHGPSPFVLTCGGTHKFSFRKFEAYLAQAGLLASWQKTPKNRLKKREDYLQEMARRHTTLQPLAELVKRIADLRQFGLTIGSDGRVRYPVMPFKADTGRNQPKTKQFLFAQSSWTRGFLKPPVGYAVGYIDWSAAEFAIAAVLSQDPAMIDAYRSGDPYMKSLVRMGLAPEGSTKNTHATIREVGKVWQLAAWYGTTAKSLVNRLPRGLVEKLPDALALAEEFLEKDRRVFQRFWQWTEARVEIFFHETHREETLFGWRHHLNAKLPEWKLRNQSLNFPMQATCAEILRWACVYATEAGIEVLAPVHDALLVGAAEEQIEDVVAHTQACMDRASVLVLGLPMRTDAKIFRYPERFLDPRGEMTWHSTMQLLTKVEGRGKEAHCDGADVAEGSILCVNHGQLH